MSVAGDRLSGRARHFWGQRGASSRDRLRGRAACVGYGVSFAPLPWGRTPIPRELSPGRHVNLQTVRRTTRAQQRSGNKRRSAGSQRGPSLANRTALQVHGDSQAKRRSSTLSIASRGFIETPPPGQDVGCRRYHSARRWRCPRVGLSPRTGLGSPGSLKGSRAGRMAFRGGSEVGCWTGCKGLTSCGAGATDSGFSPAGRKGSGPRR